MNYFVSEGSKVGAKTEVYALSDQKLQFEEDEKKRHRNLHLQSRTRIRQKTQTFCENFVDESFSEIYTLRSSIDSILDGKSNQSKQEQLDQMVESDTDGLAIYSAEADGIILYSTDGFENIKPADVTPEIFVVKIITKQSGKIIQRSNPVIRYIKLFSDDD
ncbi:MAG: hypothetical protein V8R43_03335 [Dorea sp.]